ncbi:MAG: hypothetical protein ACQEWI_01355 [Bacillota bacterium]
MKNLLISYYPLPYSGPNNPYLQLYLLSLQLKRYAIIQPVCLYTVSMDEEGNPTTFTIDHGKPIFKGPIKKFILCSGRPEPEEPLFWYINVAC